jgi:transcriptional regulator
VTQRSAISDRLSAVGWSPRFAPLRSDERDRCTKTLLLTFDNKGGILLSTSDTMADSRLDLLQGTLDLLILRTLNAGPQHGWAISERIQQISQDVLRVNQGSLYPALHRLEHQGWISAEWGVSELGRRARFYRLTATGRKQLDAETAAWSRMSGAIARVLEMA